MQKSVLLIVCIHSRVFRALYLYQQQITFHPYSIYFYLHTLLLLSGFYTSRSVTQSDLLPSGFASIVEHTVEPSILGYISIWHRQMHTLRWKRNDCSHSATACENIPSSRSHTTLKSMFYYELKKRRRNSSWTEKIDETRWSQCRIIHGDCL